MFSVLNFNLFVTCQTCEGRQGKWRGRKGERSRGMGGRREEEAIIKNGRKKRNAWIGVLGKEGGRSGLYLFL